MPGHSNRDAPIWEDPIWEDASDGAVAVILICGAST